MNDGPETRSQSFSLLETKLRPPPVREGMVFREGLVELLRSGYGHKLTLLSAPTGYGKTTLLAQWRASREETRPFAWISLDAGDSDPFRLTAYVIEAVERIESGFGENLRELLRAPGIDFGGVVLPRLVNALAALPREIVIVLDDYHLLERDPENNPTNYVLEHMPEKVQLVISARSDPPISLGRLRASGQMVEIRAPDLAFNQDEAWALMREALGVELDHEDLAALLRRTEGWTAGLYLAALVLRRSPDVGEDIRAFAGDARLVADYLTEEVLERQLPRVRRFLLKTSILDRFTAPLCDAVVGEEGSAELLEGLEHSNMFLVPLDERREWFRYHHLFAGLLRVQLRGTCPKSIRSLHRRAAGWYLEAGFLEEAIRHTLASGDLHEAGKVIARHWLACLSEGRKDTLRSWLAQIPEGEIAEYPPLALVNAWLSAFAGDVEGLERWISAAQNVGYDGPLPDGTASVESGVALIRASFVFGDAGRALDAARKAVKLEVASGSPWRALAWWTLGYSLFWTGAVEESRRALEKSLQLIEASPGLLTSTLVVTGFLALAEYDLGNTRQAERLGRRAIDYASRNGLNETSETGVSHVVLGMIEAGRGELADAEEHMKLAITLRRQLGTHNGYAHTLLAYAPVRHALGDREGGHALVEEARGLIDGYEDAGQLLHSLLDRTQRNLHNAPRRQPEAGQGLTNQELEVLHLLAGDGTRLEIATALYVSVNTVKSHIRSIYRKLGVTSRGEAVEAARLLGVIA